MKMKLLLCVLIVVFMYPVNSSSFDKEENYIPGLFGYSENTWKSIIVELYTSGIASGYAPDKNSSAFVLRDGEFAMTASGIVMQGLSKKNYIITVSHSFTPTHIRVDDCYTEVRKIQSRTIRVSGADEANILWKEEKIDLALLTTFDRNEFLKPSPFNATYTCVSGNEDYTLKPGDAVASIVGSRNKDGKRVSGLEIKRGKIISVEDLLKNNIVTEFFSELDVVTNIDVWPGDSGSPVFAFRKGVPFLVGIMRAVIRKRDKELQASYFVRIDPLITVFGPENDIVGNWRKGCK